MGGRDVRAVVNGGGGDFPVEPNADEVGYQLRGFFGGTMAYAGESDEVGVVQVAAELGRGVEGDGAVAVAPEDEGGGIEVVAEGATEAGHVIVPGLEQAQEVEDGAGGTEVVAVRLEALGGVPALGARLAAEADHLQPLGQPGHEVSEELAGAGEIEADKGITFAEVGVRG